jgi:hypothetical protein
VEILASDRWQSISLQQMISTSGKYLVRFWNENLRYSYGFELQPLHVMSKVSNFADLQFFNGQEDIVKNIPIQCDRLEQFWAKTITIRGLWTLEKVTLILSDGKSQVSNVIYADKTGSIMISLATLHGKLSDSDWYSLDFQRSGMETQRLVELVSSHPISCTWDEQAIYLSGLQLHQNYSLICWNLLTPHHEPEKIRVQNHEQDTITVPLSLSAGIYHIQIQGCSLQDLGCWCGDEKPTLPQIDETDEELENYCYIILDDEPIEKFIVAIETIRIDLQKIRLMIPSLKSRPCYLPDWLNRESLLDKLETFLDSQILKSKTRMQLSEIVKPPLSSPPKLPPRTLPQPIALFTEKQPGIWYLIETKSKGRKTFLKHLKTIQEREGLNDLITEIGIPDSEVYSDYVLLRLSAYQNGYECLRQVDCFKKIERKPPSMAQVNQMLGRK